MDPGDKDMVDCALRYVNVCTFVCMFLHCACLSILALACACICFMFVNAFAFFCLFYASLLLISMFLREFEEEVGVRRDSVRVLGSGNDALAITDIAGVSHIHTHTHAHSHSLMHTQSAHAPRAHIRTPTNTPAHTHIRTQLRF